MKINQETIIFLLDSIYDNVLVGLPGTATVMEFAQEYLSKHGDSPEKAAQALIKFQTAKCAATGFLSGVGGVIVLPFALPIDVAASYYVQMRMSAAIAYMFGHEINSDQVKTFIYLSLVGEGIKDVAQGAGIDIGKRFTKQAMKSISRAIGRRLYTKFGEKSAIKLGRLVPLAGGFIGAGVNSYYCLKIGQAAIEIFSEKASNSSK